MNLAMIGAGEQLPQSVSCSGLASERHQQCLSVLCPELCPQMWLYHTHPLARLWGPRETLMTKRQKPGVGDSSEAKEACLACETSLPLPARILSAHTQKTNSHREKAKPLRVL